MSNILCAEYDHSCREFIAFVLRRAGYQVFEASNGAQAVQIAREESIDLAILEARLPMLTGYQAARLICKNSPRTLIMFVSARGFPYEIERAFDCAPTVVDYLVKPVTATQLVQRVESVLRVAEFYGARIVRQESLARPDLVHIRLRP
ncbi:MAG: response regulator [Anaerolineae bacterium]|nr:response regulator [Anaerolineae bacterium]MDW8072127.1 response regulator [Anaerolineae bacterium]